MNNTSTKESFELIKVDWKTFQFYFNKLQICHSEGKLGVPLDNNLYVSNVNASGFYRNKFYLTVKQYNL